MTYVWVHMIIKFSQIGTNWHRRFSTISYFMRQPQMIKKILNVHKNDMIMRFI